MLREIANYTGHQSNDNSWIRIEEEYKSLKTVNKWGEERFTNSNMYTSKYEYITNMYMELKRLGSDDKDKERADDYIRIAKSFNKLYEKEND